MWLRTVDAARRGGHLYAPGIAELGGDPDRLLLIEAGDTAALPAAANDAARCPGSAAVVVESWGRLPAPDLTAGARLAVELGRAPRRGSGGQSGLSPVCA